MNSATKLSKFILVHLLPLRQPLHHEDHLPLRLLCGKVLQQIRGDAPQILLVPLGDLSSEDDASRIAIQFADLLEQPDDAGGRLVEDRSLLPLLQRS